LVAAQGCSRRAVAGGAAAVSCSFAAKVVPVFMFAGGWGMLGFEKCQVAAVGN
jgi:hypothetical protein